MFSKEDKKIIINALLFTLIKCKKLQDNEIIAIKKLINKLEDSN